MATKTYVQLPGTGTVLETNDPSIWPEAKRLKSSEGKAILQAESRKSLAKLLKPGATVYTVLRHVSSSGMSRRIDLYVIRKNQPLCISHDAARVLGYSLHNDGGLIVSGAGMDMGFHVVYALGSAMWPKGSITGRGGKPDTDGGYALHQRWL